MLYNSKPFCEMCKGKKDCKKQEATGTKRRAFAPKRWKKVVPNYLMGWCWGFCPHTSPLLMLSCQVVL